MANPPSENPAQNLLRVANVARQLDVSRKRVYQLIGQGRLEAFRLGAREWRIPRAALQRFLDDCCSRQTLSADAPQESP